MVLTEPQIKVVSQVLQERGIRYQDLKDLTTHKDFDYYWTIQFGYRNTLTKFLTNLPSGE